MHERLIEILVCPGCRGALRWDIGSRDAGRIWDADGACADCEAVYEVREGIGAFLTPELQRTDLWEESHGALTQHLSAHPEVRAQLVDGPLEELGPADQVLRAEYLDERGDIAGAEEARRAAQEHLYTPEFNVLMKECVERMTELLPSGQGPAIDVASGRGTLLEPLVERKLPLLVATDFSTRVLRRSRQRLEHKGMASPVSHLVVDARTWPFRDRTVPSLVSHMGLANILEGASDALAELRRVCSGVLLFSHAFCLPEDPVHAPLFRKSGHPLAFLDEGLQALQAAGWDAELIVRRRVPVRPTPSSTLVPEMVVDRFPSAEAEFEVVLVHAR